MGIDPRPARTRAALVEAAQEFLAEGEARPSIPQLTKRAGVAHGSFYNHFEDREDLMLQAAVEARKAHGWEEFIQIIGSYDDPVLGYLAGIYQTLLLWQGDRRTATIIATAGPAVLRAMRQEIEEQSGPWDEMIARSMATTDDLEMALWVMQGSFHTILKEISNGTLDSSDAAERAIIQYGVLLGLTREQLAPIFQK